MGSEFIEKAKRSIAKHLDRKRADLCKRDLLTGDPKEGPRLAIADVVLGSGLKVGDRAVIESCQGRLVARQGSRVVANFTSPPPFLLNALSKEGAVAGGMIAKVNQLSSTVEIAIP